MKKIPLVLTLAIAFVSCPSFKSEETLGSETSEKSNTQTFCTTFNFRYLQTQNVMYSPVVRHIEVFLDEKAFSEGNLQSLFAYISKQNPDPIHLTVVVKTNWAQLDLASDCPGQGVSGQPSDPHEYDYLQATYYRHKQVEYFRYSPATHVDSADFKEVIIRKK